MPQVARSLGWGFSLLMAACAALPALADEFREYAPAPVAQEATRYDSAPRYAPSEPDQLRRIEFDANATPPRPLPTRFEGAEIPASAVEEPAPLPQAEVTPLRPAETKRPLPLAAPPAEGRGAPRGEIPTLLTGAGSLGIVLGLFLLAVWAVRRGMPKHAALVPRDAVEVLGRAALVGKQQMHLVRCGNKILLLYASPSGVETLTEITDPDEVDRLSGICQPTLPRSEPASFRNVLEGIGTPRRGRPSLANQPSQDFDFGHLDASGRRSSQESHV